MVTVETIPVELLVVVAVVCDEWELEVVGAITVSSNLYNTSQ